MTEKSALKQAPAAPEIASPKPRPARGLWAWILVVFALTIGAWWFYSRPKTPQPAQTKAPVPPQGATGPAGRGMPIAPVVAVKAAKGDIGVYFTALGTVTPIYTVTVKSRVDGQLMHVYYTEGRLIHEGDPLVDIDPRPYQAQLTQYEGQLAKDQASLENARIDLTRYQQLIGKKAVPEQTLATQKALVVQDEGAVKADQGQIDSAKLNILYCHIAAPITGRLGLRLVDPGNYVQAASSTPLAVITQVQPISVIFTLPEDQLIPVLQRMHASQQLHVGIYSRDMTTSLSAGYLTTLDNQIDQTTGTLKLRAVVDNKSDLLVANQFVNAKLLIQQKHAVTLLPTAAIQRNSQRTYVYVVGENQTVAIRDIQLGTTEAGKTEVTSGLQPGEVVVMTGVDTLREGVRVNAQIIDDKTKAS